MKKFEITYLVRVNTYNAMNPYSAGRLTERTRTVYAKDEETAKLKFRASYKHGISSIIELKDEE